MKVKVLLNKDNPAKNEYYLWEEIKDWEMEKLPSTTDVLEFKGVIYKVHAIENDFIKNITKVIVKVIQQPALN